MESAESFKLFIMHSMQWKSSKAIGFGNLLGSIRCLNEIGRQTGRK